MRLLIHTSFWVILIIFHLKMATLFWSKYPRKRIIPFHEDTVGTIMAIVFLIWAGMVLWW